MIQVSSWDTDQSRWSLDEERKIPMVSGFVVVWVCDQLVDEAVVDRVFARVWVITPLDDPIRRVLTELLDRGRR